MLKTYELIKMLSPKLGEEEAKELVSFVEESKGDVATKADLENQSRVLKADLENQSRAVKTDLENQSRAVKTDLENQSRAIKTDLENQLRVFKAEFEKQIQTVKIDLIKWFFGFWITLLIAIILKGWL